jgi:hypothetical protein
MRIETGERPWHGWPGAASSGYARAFGERAQDLDVDFAQSRRADLVSRLLRQCLRCDDREWNSDDVWSWTLAQRLQALLAIALAGELAPLALVQRCRECNELLELHVAPEMFVRDERVEHFTWSPEPECTVRVALPTGREQQVWSHADGVTMRTMARELIWEVNGRAPDKGWEIPETWIESLGEELERHDPLTGLEIESQCPACSVTAGLAFDLEAQLLTQLHARQQQTLTEIHRLASVYHWTESAILDLPVWRRRHYLTRINTVGNA